MIAHGGDACCHSDTYPAYWWPPFTPINRNDQPTRPGTDEGNVSGLSLSLFVGIVVTSCIARGDLASPS